MCLIGLDSLDVAKMPAAAKRKATIYRRDSRGVAGAREPFFNRRVKVKNHLFDISEVSIF